MFLAWDLQDGGVVTCLDAEELCDVFKNVYDNFGGLASDEADFLYTAGHMISLFYYCTGVDEVAGPACLERYRRLKPEGLPASHFKGRGEFGDYFAYMISGSRD